MQVRPPEPRDREDLIENYLACYEERARGEPIGIVLFAAPPTVEEEQAWFERAMTRISRGDEIARVAEVDGHAVGYCGVTPRSPAGHETGHLGDLGILLRQGYRGQGVGTALLRGTLQACRGRLEMVLLSTFADNAPAQALYRKVGFRPYGRLPREIKRGDGYIDGELMYVVLEGSPAPGPQP